MMITIFGISNCDTVKRARQWLAAEGLEHRFHDVRKDGLDGARLDQWIAALGWEALLNRGGTTFRNLPDADKLGLDAARARALMLSEPAMIKRPVVDHGGKFLVGFKPDVWAAALR
jgi:Spx/MgsR family transcriptional regulator